MESSEDKSAMACLSGSRSTPGKLRNALSSLANAKGGVHRTGIEERLYTEPVPGEEQ